jgi:hypothetical protein
MEAILRAKMRVDKVTRSMNEKGQVDHEQVKLTAVYGPEGSENAEWSKWTPAADFNITINNPEAFGQLSKGHEFYVDFIPVEGQ